MTKFDQALNNTDRSHVNDYLPSMHYINIASYRDKRIHGFAKAMLTIQLNIVMSRDHRKQVFSGQANQLQSCVYREFRVISGHKFKLLCEAQSACSAYEC